MQWLHFTDFHVGRTAGPFREALASQLDAVKNFCVSEGAIDAVFLGGDIAYSGAKEEYNAFVELFLNPLRAIPALANARIFSMPGNHDFCCDDALPLVWDSLREKKSLFFVEDSTGARVRKPLAAAFAAYRSFINENRLLGPDPNNEVSTLHQIDAFPFDIVITNTAFLSNKNENSSEPVTPIPLSSLRAQLASARDQRPVFIFGHHSLSSFRREQVGQLATLLREKSAVYFHGHEHNPDATFHGDGFLQTLGFGAVYTGSLASDTDGVYRNTFTYCRLTDRLEIRAFTWEPKPGGWVETTDIQFHTCLSGKNAAGDRVRIANIPLISDPPAPTARPVPANIIRTSAKPSSLVPVGAPNSEVWNKFLLVSENIRRILQQGEHKLSYLPGEGGKTTIIITHGGKRHLLTCISAVNHVMSAKEVESFNTRLDTDDFASLTIISFGKLADDARDLYLRLRRNKNIEVLINRDITSASEQIMSAAQLKELATLDSATKSVSVLITETDVFALVVDVNGLKPAFFIVEKNGSHLPPFHELVARLRSEVPQFARMPYSGDSMSYGEETSDFDETEYLQSCYRQHNVIKYAGLASVGLRFSDLPLEELYVSATATESAATRSQRLEEVVTDHIAKFPMSDPLKEQVKRELLQSVDAGGREASQARDFCQQFDAVLMVGDPGSGKTCFVKHEILSYCERAKASNDLISPESWYSNHVPIMMQLSEAASENDFEGAGIFEIASRLLARKGMSFPAAKMQDFSKAGRLSWFFDGLDEVVSVERRAAVVDSINKLVAETTKYGNRIVVTSRPAAIHVVNLLPSLHQLEIQGLSDEDIRILALRILRLRLAESEQGLLIHQEQNAAKHETLVARLLSDCRLNSGVARLAQNPLLLTLLIMIYANSGAPSAKRHIIYEQAIQTLATVRGREAGHSSIAASDIRVRLGAVALSIYNKDSGIIPTLSEVTSVIRTAMEKQRAEQVSTDEAREFVRKVAEGTGLIAIEKRDGNDPDKTVVTFMHHSFLEYFGAIGLSYDLQNIDLDQLVMLPRWHEILTLLAGIIGENADVAPVLRRFLRAEPTDKGLDIDAKLLTFAIDCALECEIPSEGAQRLIADSIEQCVRRGPALRDPWVRSELGIRLRNLLEVCGYDVFGPLLSKLSSDKDEEVACSGIVLAGYALSQAEDQPALVAAIQAVCSRSEESVRAAVCEATSRARLLQTEETLAVVRQSIRRGRRAKLAALEAICNIPALASELWTEIVDLISDEDRNVARLASIAAIKGGLNAEVITLSAARKDVLLRALSLTRDSGADLEPTLPEISLDTVEKLWTSARVSDRILALQVLPFIAASEQYIYGRLIAIIRENTSHQEVSVALSSLRVSKAIRVCKQSDLKLVATYLDAKTVDVRLEAGKFLGCFGGEILAVEALLARELRPLDLTEFRVTVRGLGNARVLQNAAATRLFDQAMYFLDRKRQLDAKRLEAVLAAIQHMAKTGPRDLVQKLQLLLEDFRVPASLKGQVLTCIPAIMIPTPENIRFLKAFVDKNPKDLDSALVQFSQVVAAKCKENVTFVEMSVTALSELLPSLYALYRRFAARASSATNETRISQLRVGITDLKQLIGTFDEFLRRNHDASQ